MKDELNRREDDKPNLGIEKENTAEIWSDEDFGSLYVSDEVFFKLMDRVIKRLNDNQLYCR